MFITETFEPAQQPLLPEHDIVGTILQSDFFNVFVYFHEVVSVRGLKGESVCPRCEICLEMTYKYNTLP